MGSIGMSSVPRSRKAMASSSRLATGARLRPSLTTAAAPVNGEGPRLPSGGDSGGEQRAGGVHGLRRRGGKSSENRRLPGRTRLEETAEVQKKEEVASF